MIKAMNTHVLIFKTNPCNFEPMAKIHGVFRLILTVCGVKNVELEKNIML